MEDEGDADRWSKFLEFMEIKDNLKQNKDSKNYEEYFKIIIKNTHRFHDEEIMHAYIYFNQNNLFTFVGELLYYEEGLTEGHRGKERTQDGKVDFVYKTSDDSYFVVEVRHLPMEAGKSPERNLKRNKVLNQVKKNIQLLSTSNAIPMSKISGVVITNEEVATERAKDAGYMGITLLVAAGLVTPNLREYNI